MPDMAAATSRSRSASACPMAPLVEGLTSPSITSVLRKMRETIRREVGRCDVCRHGRAVTEDSPAKVMLKDDSPSDVVTKDITIFRGESRGGAIREGAAGAGQAGRSENIS